MVFCTVVSASRAACVSSSWPATSTTVCSVSSKSLGQSTKMRMSAAARRRHAPPRSCRHSLQRRGSETNHTHNRQFTLRPLENIQKQG